MPLSFLFLMDPIESIDVDADSTFVLMLESERRGHEIFYAHPRALELRGGTPSVTAQEISVRRRKGDHFSVGPSARFALDDFDAIFMRKDPPFDLDYLVSTYILDRVDRSKVVMINDPQALRDWNEKLAALLFPELTPKTLVAADARAIREFVDEVGPAVVKPLMNAGGTGVIRLEPGDDNFGSVVDLLTSHGRVMIEAQAYLPAVKEGDKRIILLDGEPIGAVNRRPRAGDLRANMHVGGVPEPSRLTDRDVEICSAIGPELRRRGLLFVGIDVIGGHLTEINVTSPTGLQEIGRFDRVSLESLIIDRVERRRAELS